MDTMLSLRRRHLLGAAGALALTGCAASRPPQGFSGQTMGSGYTVRLAGAALAADRLAQVQAEVQRALDAVDHRMSLYRADSELAALNAHAAGTPRPVSPALMTVLQAAQRVSELTGGAFDVTVAPLVQAWGFGPQARHGRPDRETLRAGRASIGHRGLELDAARGAVIKHRPDLAADLGGIAKGYGVDRAAQVLRAHGVQDYMLEVGGEVLTAGRNAQGQPWQIGIEEPDAVPRRARLVVPLSGAAMATSGDYRIYFEQAGRRYSHEIDPRTAEPIAHGLASVTVVAADAMRADALATALIVLGPQRGLALAEREQLAAHFIVRTGDGRLVDAATPAFQALGARRIA